MRDFAKAAKLPVINENCPVRCFFVFGLVWFGLLLTRDSGCKAASLHHFCSRNCSSRFYRYSSSLVLPTAFATCPSVLSPPPSATHNQKACFESPKERARVKKMLEKEESLHPGLFNQVSLFYLPFHFVRILLTI